MNKNNILFVLAIIFALWFAVTGIFWLFWIPLLISYPFGVASFFIWKNIKKDGRKRNTVIPVLLLIGLLCSLAMLILPLLGIRF